MLYVIVISLICVVILLWGMWSWWYSKRKKYLFIAIVLIMFTIFWPAILAVLTFTDFGDLYRNLSDRYFPIGGNLKIIELDRLSGFYGNEFCSKVLIKSPPENTDSIKRLMVQYYAKKTRVIDSAYPGYRLGTIYFYKYTRRTAYFINHDEIHHGWGTNTLYDLNNEAMIGFFLARYPCNNDSTKKYDIMYIYGTKDAGGWRIEDTLRSECGSIYTDNWDKYK